MILQSLYSGSGGNCILIKHKDTMVFIDAGVTGRKITSALSDYGHDPSLLDAILITHEHDDHISGAGVYLRKTGSKIYANEKTYCAIEPKLGKIPLSKIKTFDNGKPFVIKDLEIYPFHTSHDAVDSVGFRISDGVKSVAIATDLGVVDNEVIAQLVKCDAVLIEANHDVDMLLGGPYPEHLKRRILGEKGHLSNSDCALCCENLINNKVERIMLGHMSAQNNKPLVALNTVSDMLGKKGIVRNKDYVLTIAMRDRPSEIISLEG